jgi:hypothetical protein
VEWIVSFLDRSDGWVASPAGEIVESSLPRPYILTRVAEHPRLAVLLCEARVSSGAVGVPTDRERRRWWRWIQRDHGPAVVVFTDSAHSSFVWASRRHGREVAYVEHRTPGREDSLRAEIAAVVGVPRSTEHRAHGSPTAREEIAALVRMRINPDFRPPVASARLACWIGRQESAAVLRAVWRSLGEVAVLDPDCGEGDWLLETAGVLESLLAACMERMRCLLDDAGPTGRRGGRLADLDTLVSLSENRAVHPGPETFIRRLILQRNLFAVVGSRGEAKPLVRRLRDYAEMSRAAVGIDFHLQVAASLATEGRPSLPSQLTAPAVVADPAAILEEFEALAFTVRYLQDSRISGACSAAAVRAPARDVRTRCTALRRCLHAVGESVSSGGTAAYRSNAASLKGHDPCLSFPTLAVAKDRAMLIVRRR